MAKEDLLVLCEHLGSKVLCALCERDVTLLV